MNSFKKKFDHKGTYFEQAFYNNSIPTIFIHGVGLDNTMWYPQKKKYLKINLSFFMIF